MSIEYRDVQISAVIFDMDRLLVETSAVWEQPAQKLMSELGLRWSSEISKHYRGMDAKDVVITIHNLFNPKNHLRSAMPYIARPFWVHLPQRILFRCMGQMKCLHFCTGKSRW